MNIIKPKELSKIDYTNDRARSLAINMLSKHYKHYTKEEQVQLLLSIRNSPESYAGDAAAAQLSAVFAGGTDEQPFSSYDLQRKPVPVKVYGSKNIDGDAKRQMERAAMLPISRQAALMPDAHSGYGLPIGGVLATENAVIPFAVGVDIGCRMALSIVDASSSVFKSHGHELKQALKEHTHFGTDSLPDFRRTHEVMDDPAFRDTDMLRRLQGKAARQLGTSGGGNHFVEFGYIELHEGNHLGLPPRTYLALLSHSGSRGLGAAIAQHYTKVATEVCKLPREVQKMAWLDMASEAGQEYWLGMQLAGRYAKACHDTIHQAILGSMGLQALATVENHHNFAWMDRLADGTSVIVHRKGATPAHKGEAGIIPGCMTEPAYLVTGLGNEQALNSAAHGAGRAMSRQRAKESMTVSGMKQLLSSAGVVLVGGSVEESPHAYKCIDTVMDAQHGLVKVEGKFFPKIVRMNKE